MNGFSIGLLGGLLGALILDLTREDKVLPVKDIASVNFEEGEEMVAIETSPGNYHVVLSDDAILNNKER